MSTRFLEALHSGRVILMDGAMGTELIRRGLDTKHEQSHEWNVKHPAEVIDVHMSYGTAGAQCLLTNTFLAHFKSPIPWTQPYNEAAALAKSAATASAFILQDLGAGRFAPAFAFLSAQSVADCDAALLETQGTLKDLRLADLPRSLTTAVLVSFSYEHEANGVVCLRDGSTPEAVTELVNHYRNRFIALGINCGRDMDMDAVIEVVRRYRKVTDLPILARPNAGTPIRMGNRWVYPHSPKSMAAKLPELIDAGATLIGGCCGTTPAHIAAFREVIDKLGVGWQP